MTQPPPANPYASTPAPMRPEDERLWAILTHIGGLFVPLLAPLIVYLVLRDRGPFIRQHSATALNFHLTMTIASIVGGILTIVLIGFFILAAVGILSLVLAIMAALAASRGEFYTYPLSITFVR
jgi:uncharacterized Tic20 family protein